MRVSLIVAHDRERVIGREGAIPWHLPADLARFKALTMGHHLLLGRKTFEAIGRPLPGRRMLVLTRRRLDLPDGVEVVGSLEEGLERARRRGEDELFVGGGEEVYRQVLPRADRIYLTRVDGRFQGDRCFPALDEGRWQEVAREERAPDPRNPHAMTFLVLERRQGAKTEQPAENDGPSERADGESRRSQPPPVSSGRSSGGSSSSG